MTKKLIEKYIVILTTSLKKKGLLLVTAESCTGGGLAYFLSQLPDCSKIFERGYVTYSEKSKQDLLRVKGNTLKKYGAVSEMTAKEMATGALKKSHADMSIAITGLAGPSRDTTSTCSIGTVYIACANHKKIVVMEYHFSGNRHHVITQSMVVALKQAIHFLKAV